MNILIKIFAGFWILFLGFGMLASQFLGETAEDLGLENHNIKNDKQVMNKDQTYYYYNSSDDGFSQEVTLTLNADNSFVYKYEDDQVCYVNRSFSFGNWKTKNDNLILTIADSIKPKISYKEKFLRKDTVTLFFNRANEKSFFKNQYYHDSGISEFQGNRQLIFYNNNDKEVEIYYNNSGQIEIPTSKNITRIEMYLPNDNHKDNYLEINIPQNTGQIVIDNLSRYLITDFERYNFALGKNEVVMTYPWGVYELKKKN